MKRCLPLLLLFWSVSASAQVGFPSAPLGHEVWTPASNERVKTVQQSGWDIPTAVNKFNTSCCGAEQAKAAMEATIPTYQVGLPGTTQGSQITYTTAAGNRGPAGCDVTNTCNCPNATTINDAADVQDLPTVSLSGGPFDGNYALIRSCRSTTPITVTAGMKVAIWGSYFDVLNTPSSGLGTGQMIAVDSLFQSLGDADAVVNLNGGGILAYDEVIAGTDGVKLQQRENPNDLYGATLYRTHVHGGDDEIVTGNTPHHDMVQCQGGAHQLWVIESNLEGPYKNTQQALRCTPEAQGQYVGNVNVIRTYLGGSSQRPLVISPKDMCNGVPCGSFTLANTERVVWNNRFVGNASEVTWSLDPDPCGGETDVLPFFATGNAASGSNPSTGLASGTSPDVGAWNASTCVSGQQAVTPTQQSNADTYAGQIEDYATQIRTAAGASTAKTVTISSITPNSPTTDDDLTIVYSWSGFTPSAACTISWTGANSVSSPQVDAVPAGTEVLATSLFNSTGTTNFVVTCPDGGNPAVASSATSRTFTAPAAATLDFTVSPGNVTVSSGSVIDIVTDITPGSTATGNFEVHVDCSNDGVFELNYTGLSTDPYDTPDVNDCVFTANGQYAIYMVRQGITTPTKVFDVTISGGVSSNNALYVWIYDATKPYGSQSIGAQPGTLLIDGNTYDQRVIGTCPRFVTVTTEYPNIGSYSGPASLRVVLTGPSTSLTWDESNMPYVVPAGDSNWFNSAQGIPKANCGVSTVDTSVAGAYDFRATPYTSETIGTAPSAAIHAAFVISKLTATPHASNYTTADTPVIDYTVDGVADSFVEADFDGNGTYEVNCNEAANTCTATGPLSAGNHTVAVRAQGDQLHHSVALPISDAVPPDQHLGAWMLAP